MTYDEMVANIMTALAVTEDEAKSIIETDKLIDKGADPFPLTPEQKAVEKEMRRGHKAPTAYKFQKRERKPNEDKREIILSLNSFLVDFVHEYDEDCVDDDVCMTNPERQIDFTFRGKKYRIVLSAPRN